MFWRSFRCEDATRTGARCPESWGSPQNPMPFTYSGECRRGARALSKNCARGVLPEFPREVGLRFATRGAMMAALFWAGSAVRRILAIQL
jgi:hypothetical protein